jgi:hypothetical protein
MFPALHFVFVVAWPESAYVTQLFAAVVVIPTTGSMFTLLTTPSTVQSDTVGAAHAASVPSGAMSPPDLRPGRGQH